MVCQLDTFAIIAPRIKLHLGGLLSLYWLCLSLLDKLINHYQVNNAGRQKSRRMLPGKRLPGSGKLLPGKHLERVPGRDNNPLI